MIKLNERIDTIMVGAGAETQAVQKGLAQADVKNIPVVSLPMGVKPVREYLAKHPIKGKKILVLGLAGSLNPECALGDIVIYQNCVYLGEKRSCDPTLNNLITSQLSAPRSLVRGLTSDRLIHRATDKERLRNTTEADVVDMESFVIMSHFPRVAILRVISDHSQQNLPNLESAIDSQGKLTSWPLAIALARQPLAATRLIFASLHSLRVLTQTTYQLFKSAVI